jgi:hypothetical protein
LRLMTNSNLVGCVTGRSAGLSPLYGALEVKHYFTAFSTSFIPVSLFDLKSRFFAPTHMCWRPARAGAVKAGRRSTLATCSVVSRPRLDRPEHGGTLDVVGMTRPRGVRCRARETRAATLYPVGRSDPNHDARMRIGGEAPRRWTHS